MNTNPTKQRQQFFLEPKVGALESAFFNLYIRGPPDAQERRKRR